MAGRSSTCPCVQFTPFNVLGKTSITAEAAVSQTNTVHLVANTMENKKFPILTGPQLITERSKINHHFLSPAPSYRSLCERARDRVSEESKFILRLNCDLDTSCWGHECRKSISGLRFSRTLEYLSFTGGIYTVSLVRKRSPTGL